MTKPDHWKGTVQMHDIDVAIVGSGFSGLGIAIKLKTSGIESFLIFEKADDIAGVWRDNTYPGCACDTPSAVYSYSFKPGRKWSQMYAPASEIRDYLHDCAASFDLWPNIKVNTPVTEAIFDEKNNIWKIKAGDIQVNARYLILATGGLSNPALPVIPGMSAFKGKSFHTARWEKNCEYRDKNVAVIGSGASGIQLIPELAKVAKRVFVFQRTPHWVTQKMADRPFSELERFLLKSVPIYHWILRKWLYVRLELYSPVCDLRFNRFFGDTARKMLKEQILDQKLRQRLTPDYLYGCKRILFSNTYLSALNRPNVEVIAEKILRIDESGIITDQRSVNDLDVIVYATGFTTMNRKGEQTVNTVPRANIQGRNGTTIPQMFMKNGIAAYKGLVVPGFPNMFFVLGPNSAVNHNSLTLQMESQFNYIVSCLKYMNKKRFSSFEVKQEVFASYNSDLQRRLSRTVYTSGCNSFFLDDLGRNYVNWPSSTINFFLTTRKFDFESYDFQPR